jgi:methyl-accepting chemotaxis protein
MSADGTNEHTTSQQLKSGWFANLSVRVKILVATAVGALTALVVAGVGLVSLVNAQSATELTHTQTAPVQKAVLSIERGFSDARIQVASMRSTETGASNQNALDQFKGAHEALIVQIQELQSYFETGGVSTEPIVAIENLLNAYSDTVTGPFANAVMSADAVTTDSVRQSQIIPAAGAVREALTALAEMVDEYELAAIAENGKSADRSVLLVIVVALVGGGLAMAFGALVAARILRNVQEVRTTLVSLSDGDLTTSAKVASRDELGAMAAALNEAQANLRQILSDVAETSVQSVRENEVLAAASVQVATAITETSAQASVVASAAEEVSSNVQTVAAGSEQMSASIREIAQNAQEATAVARTAATTAEATNVTVSRLGESSREIGDVIKSITSIAEQTNLLALNATIEAARAGEAGKGFAVVAGEVKELAAESARAAEDVARRVEAIQNDTNSAVSAIAQIAEIVESINNYQMTIASAVEEQTATTNEMSRSVAEAATGSTEIAGNINEVAANVNQSGPAFDSLDEAITKVSSAAKDLSARVQVFKF